MRIPGRARRWWFDVGLGDGFRVPLALVDGEVQDGAGFGYRLEQVDDDGWTFLHDPRGTFTGVRVTRRESDPAAVAASHQHLSRSPESGFVRRFVAQRRDATGVDTVRGCSLSRVESTGRSERELLTFEDWRSALTDVVGMPLDDVPVDELRHLHERMLPNHRAWVAAGRP